MKLGNQKKVKTLRALDRVRNARVLDARQTYAEASAVADRTDREYRDCMDSAHQLEESMRASGGEGAAISVTAWDLVRRYLVQTREQIVQRAQVRDRAVQHQDQAGERMKDAIVEQKIVQHHAEKIAAIVLREQFATASRESDDLWLIRGHSDDAR